MEPVSARWEWRAFGLSFGPAEPLLQAVTVEKVQRSEEIYLLSATTDANVKIRYGLLDQKALEYVDSNGLQQWRPALKAEFPLDSKSFASAAEALELRGALPTNGSVSLEELLSIVTKSAGSVRAVSVSKTRSRFQINGCTAERSVIRADGTTVHSVAIEHEDPHRVWEAVKELKLDAFPNTSYPRGLKQLLGFPEGEIKGSRQAVIDVGTNSVKFNVSERGEDGVWTTVVDRAAVSRLGEDLERTGVIAPAASERTLEAIADMTAEAARLQAAGITAVGTMGLRTASNRDEFLRRVDERCGVTIDVISGEVESRIAFLAVQSALGLNDDADLVVFDTGGGSSQFTIGQGSRVERRFSLNLGAVRLTERFHLDQVVSEEDLSQSLEFVSAELSDLNEVPPPQALVGMGGAVTNLTAVMLGMATYDANRVQGSVLNRSEVDRQIELYRTRPADDRREIVGLQPNRADVILAGALIVRTIMSKLDQDSLTVSDRGLRHGILVEKFGGRLAAARAD